MNNIIAANRVSVSSMFTDEQLETIRRLPSAVSKDRAYRKVREESLEFLLALQREEACRGSMDDVIAEVGDLLLAIRALIAVYPEDGSKIETVVGAKLAKLRREFGLCPEKP